MVEFYLNRKHMVQSMIQNNDWIYLASVFGLFTFFGVYFSACGSGYEMAKMFFFNSGGIVFGALLTYVIQKKMRKTEYENKNFQCKELLKLNLYEFTRNYKMLYAQNSMLSIEILKKEDINSIFPKINLNIATPLCKGLTVEEMMAFNKMLNSISISRGAYLSPISNVYEAINEGKISIKSHIYDIEDYIRFLIIIISNLYELISWLTNETDIKNNDYFNRFDSDFNMENYEKFSKPLLEKGIPEDIISFFVSLRLDNKL